MADVSRNLGALRETLAKMEGALTRLAEIGAATSDIGRVVELNAAIGELCELIQNWRSLAQSERTAAAFDATRASLEGLDGQAIQFRFVASLTAIQATEVEGGGLADFVNELRGVPDKMQAAVKTMIDRVVALETNQEEAGRTAAGAAETFRKAEAGMARALEPLRAVMSDVGASRARTETEARGLAETSTREVATLISAFQYSDFMAQRLEHVVSMLPRAASLGSGVEALAGAQLTGVADDGAEILRDLTRAFDRLESVCDRAAGAFREEGGSAKALFAAQREALDRVLESRDAALPAVLASQRRAAGMQEDLRLVQDSFGELYGMSQVIHLAAINAGLRTKNVGRAQQVFSVISASVLETAAQCRRLIGDCKTALGSISVLTDTRISEDIRAKAETLVSSIEACSASLARSESGEADFNALRHEVAFAADAVAETLSASRRPLEEFDALLRECRAFGDRLAARRRAGEAWPDLAAVYDTYTMDRERQIHDALLGRASGVVAPSLAAAAQSLDDILF